MIDDPPSLSENQWTFLYSIKKNVSGGKNKIALHCNLRSKERIKESKNNDYHCDFVVLGPQKEH